GGEGAEKPQLHSPGQGGLSSRATLPGLLGALAPLASTSVFTLHTHGLSDALCAIR
ncbi:hypothetical protein IscW_ISCW001804, partial [Ixodes scapularis]